VPMAFYVKKVYLCTRKISCRQVNLLNNSKKITS